MKLSDMYNWDWRISDDSAICYALESVFL